MRIVPTLPAMYRLRNWEGQVRSKENHQWLGWGICRLDDLVSIINGHYGVNEEPSGDFISRFAALGQAQRQGKRLQIIVWKVFGSDTPRTGGSRIDICDWEWLIMTPADIHRERVRIFVPSGWARLVLERYDQISPGGRPELHEWHYAMLPGE